MLFRPFIQNRQKKEAATHRKYALNTASLKFSLIIGYLSLFQ